MHICFLVLHAWIPFLCACNSQHPALILYALRSAVLRASSFQLSKCFTFFYYIYYEMSSFRFLYNSTTFTLIAFCSSFYHWSFVTYFWSTGAQDESTTGTNITIRDHCIIYLLLKFGLTMLSVSLVLEPSPHKYKCGLSAPCPPKHLAFRLISGAANVIGPKICLEDKM